MGFDEFTLKYVFSFYFGEIPKWWKNGVLDGPRNNLKLVVWVCGVVELCGVGWINNNYSRRVYE